jgi:thiol:disulfide interchange protein
MGNTLICPTGFQTSPATPFTCVVQCPTAQGFDTRNVNGEAFCVYRDRPSSRLLLKQAPATQMKDGQPYPTLERLQTENPALYQQYKTIKEDYDKNMPLIVAQIDKNTRLDDAFKALQTAENVRDQSPQAYQDARIRYYTLLRGENWVNEESQRISAAEANPKVNQYRQVQNDLKTRLNQQQQTIDVVNSVKDKVLSMKDDFTYTTNTFSKQIAELKNQIEIEKKKTVAEKVEMQSWIDLLLNILITILVFGLLITIVRKTMNKQPTTTYTSSPYRY